MARVMRPMVAERSMGSTPLFSLFWPNTPKLTELPMMPRLNTMGMMMLFTMLAVSVYEGFKPAVSFLGKSGAGGRVMLSHV